MKMTKKNKKGFTLAELLIVVAIIAVLVAIAIPIFTSQLEKSRQATDAANIRATYAQAMVNYMDGGDKAASATSDAVMQSDKWDKMPDGTKIANKDVNDTNFKKTKGKKMICSITATGEVSFTAET